MSLTARTFASALTRPTFHLAASCRVASCRVAASQLATVMLLVALLLAAACRPALALKPITVLPDQDRIEVTSLGELFDSRGDSLQIETAASGDVVAGRMTVRAVTPGSNPSWIAFALTNASDRPIERWLTAERYTMFGSGAIWPDLDTRRVEAVTPSLGYVPERIKSDRADIFRITIEPGQTITYVAELSGETFARVYLWKPLDYELKIRDRQLFNGVLIGATLLLAIFLTAVFVASHTVIFPTAALVAWCVLAYLTVDFGFFHKLFQLKPENNAVYRAATEAAVAAALVVFLNTFLRLSRAPSLVRMLLGLWVAGQLALIAVAVVDPRLASTFARLSLLAVAAIGGFSIALLALRGEDRALALVPTWLLFAVWVFGAAVVVTGRLANDIAASGLVAGIVLIVVMIGFTVMQFAFGSSTEPAFAASSGGATGGTGPSQVAGLAIDGAGAAVLEWHVQRGELKVGPIVEGILGLAPGTLSVKLAEFLKFVHEADRERARTAFAGLAAKPGALLATQFRLRHADNSTRWFEVEAAGVPGADPRALRFVGLIRDITETRRAHDRLVHDAVHCSLTGVANRALFADRLQMAAERARGDSRYRPAVLLIDLDQFRAINSQHGMPVGDSLLLTIARRLQRHLGRTDLLARLGGDKFAILIEQEKDPADFAREAEQIRRAVRAPIRIDKQDLVVTGSIGIAIHDGADGDDVDLLEAAEIAVQHAKQAGSDRIELYRADMRSERNRRVDLHAEIERALEKNQFDVRYQPIIYLPTEELAGFEATVRFEHPELGSIDPTDVELPQGSDLTQRVWAYALNRAARDAARWHKELPRTERPLFVSFNVANSALLKPELVRDVRRILDHGVIPKGTLRLEIGEPLVMENPEQAGEILELLHGVGADLILDKFGAGYSALAYIGRFPIDTVKLDRGLVQSAIGGDSASAPIVRSLVVLALELGKRVVADGVEDPEDVAFLRAAGCVYAQGFYYGDPMPDRDVMQLLMLVRKAEHKLEPKGLFRLSFRRSKQLGAPPPLAALPPPSAAMPNGDGRAADPNAKPSRRKAKRTPAAANPQAGLAPMQADAVPGSPMQGGTFPGNPMAPQPYPTMADLPAMQPFTFPGQPQSQPSHQPQPSMAQPYPHPAPPAGFPVYGDAGMPWAGQPPMPSASVMSPPDMPPLDAHYQPYPAPADPALGPAPAQSFDGYHMPQGDAGNGMWPGGHSPSAPPYQFANGGSSNSAVTDTLAASLQALEQSLPGRAADDLSVVFNRTNPPDDPMRARADALEPSPLDEPQDSDLQMPRIVRRPARDTSKLPPGLAASLDRLAGPRSERPRAPHPIGQPPQQRPPAAGNGGGLGPIPRLSTVRPDKSGNN